MNKKDNLPVECYISPGVPFVRYDVRPIDLSNQVIVIEGADVYDALCPVSSVTGCRENPLQLLKTLMNDPAKSRLLDQVLAELPVQQSVKGASYEDMLSTLQSVFSDGTFYDNDKFAERLMNISEDLLKSVGIEKPIDKVDFSAPAASADPVAPAAE